MDLLEQIDWSSLECLNASPEHSINNALKQGYKQDEGLYLESDTDEQILLHIPFSTAVKLQSITIKSVKDKEHAPKQMRLFINKPTLGFSDAADLACTQEFTLTESQLQGASLNLKLVKFQRVNVLTVFFATNQGNKDTTIIQEISLSGSAGDSFNVNNIKKAGEE